MVQLQNLSPQETQLASSISFGLSPSHSAEGKMHKAISSYYYSYKKQQRGGNKTTHRSLY